LSVELMIKVRFFSRDLGSTTPDFKSSIIILLGEGYLLIGEY